MTDIVYMVHLIYWGDHCIDEPEEYLFLGIFTSKEKAQAAIDEYIRESANDDWDWSLEAVAIDKAYKWER